MYDHTRGSLLMPHLFHTTSNIPLRVLPILPMATASDACSLGLAVGLLWVSAVASVVILGPAHLSRTWSPAQVMDRPSVQPQDSSVG